MPLTFNKKYVIINLVVKIKQGDKTMKLTRVHFKMLANAVAKMKVSRATKQKVATALASELRFTNGMFDHDKFINACLK